MAKLTRRSLIKQTSLGAAGVATIGVLAAAPHLAGVAPAQHVATEQSATAYSGSMVVHVRDFSTGQLSIMHGEKEVVVHNHALVKSLLQAAG